ncbi:hypothetical protein [Eubacterium oxidoreducens]|uniref:Uncharacterized protein n=1 Tax=Eubacterium oxidoreducens TaxID=1732 RepID=A0A1G6BN71_EUBOX|nr:hypothetical protein [Eubacterium oxidoreducens]SDB22037.1 hypothetical protein SAMN02910417_01657 [Eubacterium oxidoreducens]
MELTKVKGVYKSHPERRESKNLATMAEIIEAVNGILNPNGPKINWFAPAEDAVAAVHFKDGKYDEKTSNPDVVYGGEVSDKEVKDLKVVAYDGNRGAIYAEGAGTDVTVDGAYISLQGDGTGIGGPASGASAKYNAKLTIKNAIIDTVGRTRYSTAAEEGAVLKVYDSVIWSHGIPFGEGIEKPTALMSTPPGALEMDGNTRTHCSMSNSLSYFYNSKIICDGWAALSTESSEGFVYLEANDCDIVCTKDGYGAYADPGCHDFFNDCNFDMARMAAIIAGNSDMTFNDCNCNCGTYFALSHCVNGWPEEVGEITVNGGTIKSKKEAFLIKSHNFIMDMCDVDIMSESGVLVHTIVNDDPCATKAEDPYGVNVLMTDMDVTGDLVHEDTTREMWVELNSTVLTGAIKNANLTIDEGSKWIATGDSDVVFMNDISPAQIDAKEGVTIHAKGAEAYAADLASGGKLVVTV